MSSTRSGHRGALRREASEVAIAVLHGGHQVTATDKPEVSLNIQEKNIEGALISQKNRKPCQQSSYGNVRKSYIH